MIVGIWHFLTMLPPAKLLHIRVPTPKDLPAGLSIRPYETPLELKTAIGIDLIHPRSVAHKLAESTWEVFDIPSGGYNEPIAEPLRSRFEKIRISTDEGFVQELVLPKAGF
jgi:hypothetical protein